MQKPHKTLWCVLFGTPCTQILFSPGNGGIGGISGDGGLPEGGGPLDGIGAEAGGAAAAVAGLALALSALLKFWWHMYIFKYYHYHLNLAIHSSRANPGPCWATIWIDRSVRLTFHSLQLIFMFWQVGFISKPVSAKLLESQWGQLHLNLKSKEGERELKKLGPCVQPGLV